MEMILLLLIAMKFKSGKQISQYEAGPKHNCQHRTFLHLCIAFLESHFGRLVSSVHSFVFVFIVESV